VYNRSFEQIKSLICLQLFERYLTGSLSISTYVIHVHCKTHKHLRGVAFIGGVVFCLGGMEYNSNRLRDKHD
jgi:hypothetical protein